jgi:hypothetical protein
MRNILVIAGLTVAAALVTGTPARAELGCGCFKLGVYSCTATIGECMSKVGGLCALPCDYVAPKKMARKKHKKKM